ncbi:hypothetical protein FQ142_04020 [Microbacterium sp. ANT_H45B]|uniref:hypothetical protein n=1 Tax=Microbacterium sp. ANT_H45B TaxID=2597346 RepID=UPI0011EBBEC6|nr:hypothetical protein [Microbacterium sp. ANT_H45B]KAA0962496.1 hypothetical protein FQ142_04020 [Microbacterium sp. ANT_H45B]
MTVSTFTDSVGLTRRHWLYFALITALLLCDGMDVTIVSHTFPSLVKEWGVSVGGGITFVETAGFVSMLIGAGLGLSDLFVVVLVPIGILIATVVGLKLDARRTAADSIVGYREDLAAVAPPSSIPTT